MKNSTSDPTATEKIADFLGSTVLNCTDNNLNDGAINKAQPSKVHSLNPPKFLPNRSALVSVTDPFALFDKSKNKQSSTSVAAASSAISNSIKIPPRKNIARGWDNGSSKVLAHSSRVLPKHTYTQNIPSDPSSQNIPTSANQKTPAFPKRAAGLSLLDKFIAERSFSSNSTNSPPVVLPKRPKPTAQSPMESFIANQQQKPQTTGNSEWQPKTSYHLIDLSTSSKNQSANKTVRPVQQHAFYTSSSSSTAHYNSKYDQNNCSTFSSDSIVIEPKRQIPRGISSNSSTSKYFLKNSLNNTTKSFTSHLNHEPTGKFQDAYYPNHSKTIAKKKTTRILPEFSNHSISPSKRPQPVNNIQGKPLKKPNIGESPSTTLSNIKSLKELSPEQQYISELVLERNQNIFFTGNAGTGKSFLLRQLLKRLRCKYRKDEIAITAPTGMAACNIDGVTLHAFIGLGLVQGPIPQLAQKIKRNSYVLKRWQNVKVLVIDELSMIDAVLFDKVEVLAQVIKKNDLPFGGIQIIACGDFLQLPPVGKDVKMCFESDSWDSVFRTKVMLTHVFRQSDPVFIRLLDEMRLGCLSEDNEKLLYSLNRPLDLNIGIDPPQLYALRGQVEHANKTRLAQLPGKLEIFKSKDNGDIQKLNSAFLVPEILQLKINAQVMLVKNIPGEKLVNGSLGKVVGFSDTGYPLVDFVTGWGDFVKIRTVEVNCEIFAIKGMDGEDAHSRFQVPLVLAYAMSIHKSQGQTLPYAIVDLGKVFDYGQAYVAISRVIAINGLQVLNFNPRVIKSQPKVVEFYKSLQTVDIKGQKEKF